MSDNVNIIVQDTINDIVVNSAVTVETIDINVQVAVDEVTIIANPNEYVINVNRIIGEQVQSDWNETDDQAPDYIKNKPTNTSDFINDGEDGINPFITLLDIPPSTIPTLQQVTDEGNITTNSITVDSVDYYSIIEPSVIGTENKNTGNYTYLGADGVVGIRTEGFNGLIKTTNLTEEITLEFPEKPTGTYTIATTTDLSDYVLYEGATQNVDLGVYDITAAHLIKDGGVNTQFLKADGSVDNNVYLTSVGLSMPVAFNVANSPLTSDGTIAVSAAGTSSQYIRGDGQLATLPSGGGGGASVFYYLNGSIAASVATYKQLSNTAVIGVGTDFAITGNGLITQFLTDVGNPNRLQIPSGAWNFEMFFSMSSSGGTPKFYVELLKYNGATFTTIANNSAVPETITGGTSIDLYLSSLAVPETTLLLTDRLAIRVYIVNNSGGRTATLHTENSHLCQIITTFASGIAALNGLTSNNQYLTVGTSGTNFNISSVSETHTFNLPTASAANRGALSTTDWTTFNGKFNLPSLTAGSVLFSNGTTIAQDNSNFFWDDTNNRLGIGTASPTQKLTIVSEANGLPILGTALGGLFLSSTNGLYGLYSGVNGLTGDSWFQAMRNNSATAYNILLNPVGGNVGIGMTPTAKLTIKAPGALSTDIALKVRNSADSADLMTVAGDGSNKFNGTTITPVKISSTAGASLINFSDSAGAGTYIGSNNNSLWLYTNDLVRLVISNTGNVLIGTTTNIPSSKLTVESTTQGFLPPRMTTTQKNAIATPASGLVVYDTTLGKLCVRGATAWETITSI